MKRIRHTRGFTLTELLVVLGLIAMLISLIMPVMTKARAAAFATGCMSNLRQMGQAWEMYTAEHRGRLQVRPGFDRQPHIQGHRSAALDQLAQRGAVLESD